MKKILNDNLNNLFDNKNLQEEHQNSEYKQEIFTYNINNEKGLALIESFPALFIIVLVFNFSLGFFGAIHSGILNSIGAYNYTLETFRFKSNLYYFRPGGNISQHYANVNNRVHGVIQDGNSNIEERGAWPATVRGYTFTNFASTAESEDELHAKSNATGVWSVLSTTGKPDNDVVVKEIYLKTIYGICLNADCE